MDCLDLLAVQGTLKSLLQHHRSKASIHWCSASFIVQLSHPCMTTAKTIAFTRWTFVDNVMSQLFNMLSRLVMIWATVSSQSCFCWLYRASPSLAAKNIISLISMLAIWWCPCIESSIVLLETPGVGDGQGGLACCSSWGRKGQKRLSDWTELKVGHTFSSKD